MKKLKMDCRTASPHINDETLENTGPYWEMVTKGTFPYNSCWELHEEKTQKTWKLLVEKQLWISLPTSKNKKQ